MQLLLACTRYVEFNRVRATLAAEAKAWPWSSARAHLAGRDDDLDHVGPMLELVGDWAAFLAEGLDGRVHAAIRSGERTGRPLGGAAFVAALERCGGECTSQSPNRGAGCGASCKGGAYHAVPINSHTLGTFGHHVATLWLRMLRRYPEPRFDL